MLGFIIRRLVTSLVVLFLSSIIVFLLVSYSGSPMTDLLSRHPRPPQSVIDNRRHQLYLDRPVPVRYQIWLGKFVKGDMGKNLDGAPVRPILAHRLAITLRMVFLAMVLAFLLAVAVGVLSAVRQYSLPDYIATFTGFVFLSMPVFWLAVLLKEFLAVKLNQALGRQILFYVGDQTPNLAGSFLSRFGNQAGHLVLPTITLALIYYAGWSRFQRSAMLDVLNSDYIRLARAKGLSNRRVLVRHALRNAMIPLTTIVAIDFASILGGAIITEIVFSWQGMGQLFLDGLTDYDLNVVLAWLMITAFIVIVFNLLADMLYGVLDPRIRLA